MLCSRISFHLSVKRVVSTVIIVGSAVFYFLLRPIWARSLGVGDQRCNQLEDILFGMDVRERVISHTLGKIDGIQHLDFVAVALQQFAAFDQDLALWLLSIRNEKLSSAFFKVTAVTT